MKKDKEPVSLDGKCLFCLNCKQLLLFIHQVLCLQKPNGCVLQRYASANLLSGMQNETP